MGRLVYANLCSLDGYVADERGEFGWARPDEEVHAFVNDLERPIGTHLYGRRMYEVMTAWDDPTMLADERPYIREYAEIWQATDKIVYSTTLQSTAGERTRIERAFEPEAVRALKESAAADLGIGGPELAGQALRAGLVDELHMFVAPAIVGGGTRALPDGARTDLELFAERRFAGGMVHLGYVTR